MKIGIDISQIVYGTGVSVYTKNLVENLLKIDKENEYTLFFSSLRRDIKPQISKIKSINEKSKIKTFKVPPTLLEILWNRFHILPVEKLIGELDIFHSSDWTEPPAKCPKVTTIHDLTPLLFPQEIHPRIVAVHKRKLEWVKKESKLIIAVSENTKKDIVKLLNIPAEKIKVVYEAVNKKFKIQSSKSKVEKTKENYGIEGDYFLAFAGPPRKNLSRVVRAFVSLGGSDLQQGPTSLVIVGRQGLEEKSLGESLADTDGIRMLGYVSNEELVDLYAGALCLVYPSLYEGFGLPILEAMACGCPVVTSCVSSMPEVAGEAAILVDPLSVESIAGGIKMALENRGNLIKKGYQQVKKFSWEKCARETLRIYEEVAG